MNYELLQGNCLEVMKNIEGSSIDLTVTSPPYDNLRTYNGYSFDFEGIAKEIYRVTKDGGVVVWIVNDAVTKGSETGTSFRQALYFKDTCGFNLHDTMIWEKSTFSSPIKSRYHSIFEYMFVFSKGAPKTCNLIVDKVNKTFGRTTTTTFRDADGTTSKRTAKEVGEFGKRNNIWKVTEVKHNKFNHPAPFPEELAYDHILSWSNEGDTVLDPFLGSGTTGKMAILNNRNFIGIEISEEYLNIAKNRISNAVLNKVTPSIDKQQNS